MPFKNRSLVRRGGKKQSAWCGCPSARRHAAHISYEAEEKECNAISLCPIRSAIILELIPLLVSLLLGVRCVAADFADNKFTDGNYFSVIWESEHYRIVPGVSGSHWRENWLVCWNIAALREGRENVPTQSLFLDTLRSPLYLGDDFRASEPRSLILRQDVDNHQLALYEISKHGPAKLIKTLDVGDPQRNRPWVTRSESYFFLQNPASTIYCVTNLAPLKVVKSTKNLEAFYAVRGWVPHTLTDDLNYLINPIWENSDGAGLFFRQQASCYNIETDELQTIKIHSGTNRTTIVGAESINGHPVFLALWQPEKATSGGAVFWFKHLGVFDDQSSLIADVPIPPMDDTDFHRAALWDYAHSRVFLYSKRTLTEFDYGKQTVRRFPLSLGRLKVL